MNTLPPLRVACHNKNAKLTRDEEKLHYLTLPYPGPAVAATRKGGNYMGTNPSPPACKGQHLSASASASAAASAPLRRKRTKHLR